MKMNQKLMQLENEVNICRKNAQKDTTSTCHAISGFKCHAYGDYTGISIPNPSELGEYADILVVGINPKCSLPIDAPPSEENHRKETGKLYHAYLDYLVGGIKESTVSEPVIVHTNLVICGTDNGSMVKDQIGICRSKFFDKVVSLLKPKIILLVGSHASSEIFWNDTIQGKSGARWDGIRRRHATSDEVIINSHKCKVVYVLQPSSYVSMEKRNAAKDMITNIFDEIH
jgi:uracil-DNA glycosylase